MESESRFTKWVRLSRGKSYHYTRHLNLSWGFHHLICTFLCRMSKNFCFVQILCKYSVYIFRKKEELIFRLAGRKEVIKQNMWERKMWNVSPTTLNEHFLKKCIFLPPLVSECWRKINSCFMCNFMLYCKMSHSAYVVNNWARATSYI